jgi:hypothetical protein
MSERINYIPVGPKTREFLLAAGFDEDAIANFSGSTRMQHDMHLLGDNLFDTLDIMRTKFGVDMSCFDWRQYSPDEAHFISPRHILTSKRRLIEGALSRSKPISLQMIEEALVDKKWKDVAME